MSDMTSVFWVQMRPKFRIEDSDVSINVENQSGWQFDNDYQCYVYETTGNNNIMDLIMI
jgi:hypothetical protein